MDERFKNPLENTEKMEDLLKKSTEELRNKSKEYREAAQRKAEETLDSGKEKVRDLFNQADEDIIDKPNTADASETVQEIEEVLEENNPTEIEDETLEHIEYHATEEEDQDEPDAYTNNEDLEVEEQIVPPTINDQFSNKEATELNANADILNEDVPQVILPEAILAEEPVIEENIEGIKEADMLVLAMIDDLRNLNFARDYGILMYALAFPLIFVLLWQYIQGGYTMILLVTIPLIIFFFFYRSTVRGKADKVFSLKGMLQSQQQKPKEELFTKVDYVDAGIDLNHSRVNYTKFLYMLFAPFLFYAFANIWKGPFDWTTTLYLFGVGYFISLVILPFLFKSDTKRLEEIRAEVYDLKRGFL